MKISWLAGRNGKSVKSETCVSEGASPWTANVLNERMVPDHYTLLSIENYESDYGEQGNEGRLQSIAGALLDLGLTRRRCASRLNGS